MGETNKEIPIRRVSITSEQQWNNLPNRNMLGTTPNGNHFYGTTPGGTRIVYDRIYLLQQKDIPLSNTPPNSMTLIPGITQDLESHVRHTSDEASGDNNSRKCSNESGPLQSIDEKEELSNLPNGSGDDSKNENDNVLDDNDQDDGAYDYDSENDIEIEI